LHALLERGIFGVVLRGFGAEVGDRRSQFPDFGLQFVDGLCEDLPLSGCIGPSILCLRDS
jgi:hypothetical protein